MDILTYNGMKTSFVLYVFMWNSLMVWALFSIARDSPKKKQKKKDNFECVVQ